MAALAVTTSSTRSNLLEKSDILLVYCILPEVEDILFVCCPAYKLAVSHGHVSFVDSVFERYSVQHFWESRGTRL
jgi:hypothetical protein